MVDKVYLTPQQLSMRWQINIGTLTNWRLKGTGPIYTKLGAGRNTKVLYRLDHIEMFEDTHLRPNHASPRAP